MARKKPFWGFFARVKLYKLETIPAGLDHSFNPTYHFLHPQVSVCLESWGDYQRKEDGQTGKLEMVYRPSPRSRAERDIARHPFFFSCIKVTWSREADNTVALFSNLGIRAQCLTALLNRLHELKTLSGSSGWVAMVAAGPRNGSQELVLFY